MGFNVDFPYENPVNLFIGDSHILCFESFARINYNLFEFSASSIRGLNNRKSTTGTGKYIIGLLRKNKYDKIFIMFGKVDLEWVYPYKLSLGGVIDVNSFFKETIDSYSLFIETILKYSKNVYILEPIAKLKIRWQLTLAKLQP